VHDLNLTARFCDKLIAMKDGCVVAAGSVEDILTSELVRLLFHVDAKIDREPESSCFHVRYIAPAG
jgi:iron complex transport system ATP-binding protein